MLGFGLRGGGFDSRTSQTCPTCPTSLTRPRTHPDSCSFALFVLFRGLKQVKNILTFPSHECHKLAHERAGAASIPFLRVDFLIASASTIRMSADRIRKLADTIRRLMGGSKAQNERKRAGRGRMEDEKNRGTEVWNKQREAMWEMRPLKQMFCAFSDNKVSSKKATATRSFQNE